MSEPEPPRDLLHDGQDGEVNEDFLYHLYRGGELLAGGKNFEARDELERANHLKPQDPKAQGLLGLVYFKLGLLERAVEIYGRLVQDNPSDATLRTNLGLVHLKAGQLPAAIQQLEAAIGVVPDHSKALNYLGLAYAQAQAHDKAKRAFERAGNPGMARKMELVIKGDDAPFKEVDQVTPDPQAPQAKPDAKSHPRAAPKSEAGVTTPSEAPAAPARAAAGGPSSLGLAELARLSVYDPPAALPFQVDRGGVTLNLNGPIRSRLTGLLWARGEIQRQGEHKRFRGRATEKPFGEGGDRVFRLSGKGQLVLAPLGQTFTPIDLDDEAAYLVEDLLFAFEEALWYENGRVPSKSPPDLNLVHIRGRGKALLRSPGQLRSVEVRRGEPLQMPIDRLVGWMGQLTPTLLIPDASEQAGQTPMGRWARLEGEGWALWALPMTAHG